MKLYQRQWWSTNHITNWHYRSRARRYVYLYVDASKFFSRPRFGPISSLYFGNTFVDMMRSVEDAGALSFYQTTENCQQKCQKFNICRYHWASVLSTLSHQFGLVTRKKNENQKLSCRWHCRETRYSDWNQLKWSSWHQLTVDPAFVSYDNLFLTSTIIATDFMRFTSPFFLTFILGRVCVCLSFCTFQSF